MEARQRQRGLGPRLVGPSYWQRRHLARVWTPGAKGAATGPEAAVRRPRCLPRSVSAARSESPLSWKEGQSLRLKSTFERPGGGRGRGPFPSQRARAVVLSAAVSAPGFGGILGAAAARGLPETSSQALQPWSRRVCAELRPWAGGSVWCLERGSCPQIPGLPGIATSAGCTPSDTS